MDERVEARYVERRAHMVEQQLCCRGVYDERVLAAMNAVERHLFVPEERRAMAYQDHPLPIGFGQTISQPYMVAKMTECLQLSGGEQVLEVGSGSGYQAAVLAAMGCQVVTVERLPELAERARANLTAAGFERVQVECSDGTVGFPAAAPYDRIIVTAAGPTVPPSLQAQLVDGGILVIPVGDRWMQELLRVERRQDDYVREIILGCVFVPLIGAEGWEE